MENKVNTVVLGPQDIAKMLKVSTRTILNMLKDGTLQGRKVKNRWYIQQEDYERTFGVGTRREPASPPPAVQSLDMAGISQALEALDHLRSTLSNRGSLLSSALTNGVETIYAPRRASGETNDAIEKLIKNAEGEILLGGVSLRQFFHDKPFRKTLWEKLSDSRPVKVRALLINPMSRAARARMYVEEAITVEGQHLHYESREQLRRSNIFKDIETSIETIKRFRIVLQNTLQDADRLDVRFYDCTPFAFFILTEQGMIIEQYHFGREESPVGGCVGELVPLLYLNEGSDFYKIMKNSFNHLWQGGNPFISIKKLDEVDEEMYETPESPTVGKRKTSQRRGLNARRAHR